ncbi:Membrane protein implicated in regulation of membrane protease activity [Andreprevotia lacus DSM 23236]|jgi:membrane protein implicated in regulation of membrane protease activity|uniref:Membrane protein implicated in regulation of membrane protease activity n=1 Tax=Andreprevotia lacus DSM 23236 TaxID=1121001 RepID=A0A1W1XPT4_9NEIS|nr:NfeD family protein [Andreprevotia lacus]SMC25896.1 Membrane protein implicated in regulation of membrane protease activity [Andreprevotia lacus DSM 23236]
MNNTTLWLIAATALIVAEMFSGTFYLLAIAAGLLLGALCSWIGLDTTVQLLVASVGTLLAVWLARSWKRRIQPASNTANQLDVGQRVDVDSWLDERHARVRYRGTLWTGELAAANTPRADSYFIVAQRGNTLILDSQPH